MRTVLGIDAAWTEGGPSGVALVVENDGAWRCVAVAPSYSEFVAQAHGKPTNWATSSFAGEPPNIERVLGAAERLARRQVDLMTVDIPVATEPFSSRRVADRAISQEFGSRWCSAHSPTSGRPGAFGSQLSREVMAAGFSLITSRSESSMRALLEVYPHPALLSLLRQDRRVPYKISKAARYWPKTDVRTRIARLLEQLKAIHQALSDEFGPLPFDLPAAENVPSLAWLKRFEDSIDALVCAWVGGEYLRGRAIPLGDETAAIWCPADVCHTYSVTPPAEGLANQSLRPTTPSVASVHQPARAEYITGDYGSQANRELSLSSH